jgi:hypothetical protein
MLKYHYGKHDAVAASLEANSKETLQMLAEWANLILIVGEQYLVDLFHEKVTATWQEPKVKQVNIGKDMWGMSCHPDLIPIVCKELEARGFMTERTLREIQLRGKKYEERRAARDRGSDPVQPYAVEGYLSKVQ